MCIYTSWYFWVLKSQHKRHRPVPGSISPTQGLPFPAQVGSSWGDFGDFLGFKKQVYVKPYKICVLELFYVRFMTMLNSSDTNKVLQIMGREALGRLWLSLKICHRFGSHFGAFGMPKRHPNGVRNGFGRVLETIFLDVSFAD